MISKTRENNDRAILEKSEIGKTKKWGDNMAILQRFKKDHVIYKFQEA